MEILIFDEESDRKKLDEFREDRYRLGTKHVAKRKQKKNKNILFATAARRVGPREFRERGGLCPSASVYRCV